MNALKPYANHSVRVVSFDALDAMCEYVSGVSHEFQPVKLTQHQCWVQYSNPDEYGTPDPVAAVYPVYRQEISGETMICVVLDIIRIIGHPDEYGVMWQAFERLTNCPTLHRDPTTGEWHTAEGLLDDTVQRLVELHDTPAEPSDPVIISWRASNIQDIALDGLGRTLTDDEMDVVVHELDKLNFGDVDQCIEETILSAVEKFGAEIEAV